MPHIPLNFPFEEGIDIEDAYLEFSVKNGIRKITWPGINSSVFHKNNDGYPDISDFKKHTPELIFHGNSGFSLGNYHEFLITDIDELCALNFDKTEVTFGEPSPLITYLFRKSFNKSIHGEWAFVKSIRIFECQQEFAELLTITAINKYASIHDEFPTIFEVFDYYWKEEQNPYIAQKIYDFASSISGDIEPLRCIYHARQNNNSALACIQYYRVLEYYSSILTTQKIRQLRFDANVSEKSFLNQIQTIGRDEKSALIRLIDSLENSSIINYAANNKLITESNSAGLGAKLYEFRNSIVHAKDDYKSPIHVDSIFIETNKTILWHTVLKELANLSISKHSTTLVIK